MSATHTASMTPLICWSCRERALGPHFCSNCGKIQQLPCDVDYFAFFGLPRKLWIEGAELEKKFLQLSWQLHPDNFVHATEREKDLSLERSSQLNDAYRTLREPISRIEYLLAIEGARKEGEHKQQAPPELLEEVFGLNESLDELREAKAGGGDLSALKTRLEAAENNFQEKLAAVVLGIVDLGLATMEPLGLLLLARFPCQRGEALQGDRIARLVRDQVR